jgi:hypothetical protein
VTEDATSRPALDALASASLAAIRFQGTEIFSDWAAKMALHATSHTSWTIGFRTIFNTIVDEPSFSEHSAIAVAG